MSVPVRVPGGGPLFDGHFPGRPVLPGVAALAMICGAIAPQGGPADVVAIRSVRFRSLLEPGSTLDIEAAAAEAGVVRFDAFHRGRLAVNGTVAFGVPVPSSDHRFAIAARTTTREAELDALIAHRPPARLVEAVLGEAEDGATCLARIPAGSGLAHDGSAPALAALEAAAQTAAVWEGLRRRRERVPEGARLGYLVSLREVTFGRARVPVEAELFASARLTAAALPLSHYAVEVVCEGVLALRGTIGTYLAA